MNSDSNVSKDGVKYQSQLINKYFGLPRKHSAGSSWSKRKWTTANDVSDSRLWKWFQTWQATSEHLSSQFQIKDLM